MAERRITGPVNDPGRPPPAAVTLGTEVSTSSGPTADFTGIPAGTVTIDILFEGVSSDTTDPFLVQLGDAGGFEATGYVSSYGEAADGNTVNIANRTDGFPLRTDAASDTVSGIMSLRLKDATNFTWISNHVMKASTSEVLIGAGNKDLSAELTQVRVTLVSGNFDGGSINIQYQ